MPSESGVGGYIPGVFVGTWPWGPSQFPEDTEAWGGVGGRSQDQGQSYTLIWGTGGQLSGSSLVGLAGWYQAAREVSG